MIPFALTAGPNGPVTVWSFLVALIVVVSVWYWARRRR